MYWTKEMPVKDGYYWLEQKVGGKPTHELVNVVQGVVLSMGSVKTCFVSDHRNMRWYGPLTPPSRESYEG